MIAPGPWWLMFTQAFFAQAGGYFAVVSLLYFGLWKLGARRFEGRRLQHPTRVDGAQLRREILHTLTTLALGTLNAVGLSLLFASGKTQATLATPGVLQSVGWVIGLLALNETWFYFWHRLLHHRRLFRYVHAVHHRSVDVNPFSSYSFHPLEALVLGGWVLPVAIWLPVPLALLGVLQGVGLFNNVVSHLGYEFYPRWFLRVFPFSWLNSATFHNLHHTRFHSNFGLMTRVWDRLLGTEDEAYEASFADRRVSPPRH